MAYKNPLAWDRCKRPGQFEYNPNAQMPEPVPYVQNSDKLWDDSDISDEEMDALLDRENYLQERIHLFSING